jgi:Flp pilus assembly protein TadG
MIMTAIFMVLLFLMLGMVIDLSRVYMVRAEMQNAADAAALAAAKELNGGGSGIDAAVARAQAVLNTHGFAKAGVGLATISFAPALVTNPYIAAYDSSNAGVTTAAAKAVAPTIAFVKVTTQPVSMNVLFAIQVLGTTHSQTREAVAGVSVGVSGICDFFPAAVGLNDRDNDSTTGFLGFTPPLPGTLLNLNFSQGTGNEAVVNHLDYIILEIPNITGNGTPETALLTAGIPNICKSLGDNINMTPSSNPNNGPRNSGDGLNTRFGVYANGYGNLLQPSTFPPDTNVTENITAATYFAGPPIPNLRRRIVAPIIAPGTYPAYTSNIRHWGVFFITRQAVVNNGNCDPAQGCGSFQVEYVEAAATGIVFGDPACQSQLNAPVLYK